MTAGYFDNAATAPMLPAALDAYVQAAQIVGNPSSVHAAGQRVRAVVETGRRQVAASLGADPAEVIFTSGGTESINQAIKGIYWARAAGGQRPIVIVADGEHHASLEAARWLAEAQGAELRLAPIDHQARLDLDWLAGEIDREGARIALISVLWANNEVGTVQPIKRVCALAAVASIPVHVDAVSAYGQVPIDMHAAGVTALSVSAHKIGGPGGTGALLLTRTQQAVPLLHGGGQERKVRSGTLDAPSIAAFGVAAEHAMAGLPERAAHLRELRDRLVSGIHATVPEAVVTGHATEHLPANAHAVFPGCEGDSLLFLLDQFGVSASTGSACTAGVPQPSHVLEAMGFSAEDARSALRFSLGETTTEADVDRVLEVLPEVYARAHAAGMSARVPRHF